MDTLSAQSPSLLVKVQSKVEKKKGEAIWELVYSDALSWRDYYCKLYAFKTHTHTQVQTNHLRRE